MVRERLVGDPGGPIGQTGKSRHLHAERTCLDGFKDRRHSHRIGSECAQHTHLRRCFVLRAGHTGVDPFGQRQAGLGGQTAEQTAQARIVDFRHVEKIRSTRQRRRRREIQVVAQHHPSSGGKARIQRAGRIGQDQHLRPERGHQAHVCGHLARRVTLVVMNASFGQKNRHAPQFGAHEFPRVPGHLRFRQTRNLRIGHGKKLVAGLGESPEPGAQDQGNLGTESGQLGRDGGEFVRAGDRGRHGGDLRPP